MKTKRVVRTIVTLLVLTAWSGVASGQYTFQGLGVFDELSSEAVAINDSGQIAGTLAGT